jgi:hypothetical protein
VLLSFAQDEAGTKVIMTVVAGQKPQSERESFGLGLFSVKPILAVAITGADFAMAGAAALPRAFLPAFNESTLLVGVALQPGSV